MSDSNDMVQSDLEAEADALNNEIDDEDDDIPAIKLDKMIPQKVVADSSRSSKYKPSNLDKLSFVQLDLHDSSRRKVSKNSLPVAAEVENAKKALVDDTEDFPSFHTLKKKVSGGLNHVKKTLSKTKSAFGSAIHHHITKISEAGKEK